jgi:hypothetical protein
VLGLSLFYIEPSGAFFSPIVLRCRIAVGIDQQNGQLFTLDGRCDRGGWQASRRTLLTPETAIWQGSRQALMPHPWND